MPPQGCDGNTSRAKRRVRFSTQLKKRCMLFLQLRYDRFRDDPAAQIINAALLGRALKHWPGYKRESLRREVRFLVKEMRMEGAPIASGGKGYWIATTVEDFQKTEEFLRSHGIAELVTNAKIKQSAAHDRAVGQTRLSAYHALKTGLVGGLSLYMKPSPNLQPPIDSSAAGREGSAAQTAEQSGDESSGLLFALT